MILRGCKLRNTEHVYGLSVFTGHDSKVMMNSTNAKYKFSTLENAVNKGILFVLSIQITLASIGGFTGVRWIFSEAIAETNDFFGDPTTKAWYLEFKGVSQFVES